MAYSPNIELKVLRHGINAYKNNVLRDLSLAKKILVLPEIL